MLLEQNIASNITRNIFYIFHAKPRGTTQNHAKPHKTIQNHEKPHTTTQNHYWEYNKTFLNFKKHEIFDFYKKP